MKHKPMRRILAGLLAGMLCLSMTPGAAFAEDATGADPQAPEAVTAAATPETATPETALSPEAQAFVDAVNALDREAILAAVRQWAIASAAWQADPDNAELEAALNEAIAASDEAAAPVYAAEDLYYAIPEEEQRGDEVQAAYTALAALVASMQLAMEQPELPEDTGAPPDDEEIYDVLYGDLPDKPTGSYIGSMGLPIATGETRISISEWVTDLYDGVDAHIDAAALHADGEIITVDRLEGEDYAIVPIMVQAEYPANGSSTEIILPDSVTLLDYEGNVADAEESENILHASYTDTSAAAHGIYVQAAQDFTADFVYTAPDGTELRKSLEVKVSDVGCTNPIVTAKSGISTYAAEPTPPFTTGKITSIAFEGGTWLIWFNGVEAYCCSHGLSGQPNGCPTYSFAYVSKLEPGQYTPGAHYANQINIWGGLNQLSLGLLEEKHSGASATTYGLSNDAAEETAYRYYDDTQLWIMEHYPDSLAAQTYRASAQALAEHSNGNGFTTYSGENGYYTYIYTPPAGYAWQTVAIVGEEISEEGGTDVPDIPESQYYASWSAGPQTASGSLDLSYGLSLHKIGLVTGETIDEAVFEITPSATGGSIDGGSWSLTPAGSQTVTTGGHVMDDTYHTTGGNASASWSLHYTVSKTSGTASGNVGPYSSQEEANAAAGAAQSEAVSRLQGEAQAAVDAAIASARSQLANITFTVRETSVPHGFDAYTGSTGSEQQVSVPADGSTDVTIHNEEWSIQVNIAKIDSETHQPIATDAEFAVFEWDTVEQLYIPFGGYNQYSVVRNEDGSYSVANGSSYVTGSPANRTLYYTQRNEGKFIIVETRAPEGYYGDWSDITQPGTAGQVEGKRAYAFTISKDNDGSVIDLSNEDYNADIGTADNGGTLLRTPEGNTVTVTLYDAPQDATRTYTTDSTGLANNEDSYTSTPVAGKFTNDRVIGEIVLTKSDLDQAVEGADTAHVVRGLHLNQSFAPDYADDLGKVYTLTETRPADGYTTARSIQFYLKQASVNGVYTQETELWVRETVANAEYQTGSIISPLEFADDEPGLLQRALDAVTGFFTGTDETDTQDGVVIANWVCTGGTLTVTFTDDATEAAIAKCLHERDFAGLDFDRVYLINGTAPEFFQELQVSEKPADSEVVYTADWHKAEGTTITMVDAPTRIRISKLDITTGEEVPGAELQIVDSEDNILAEWVTDGTPHYIERLPVGTLTLIETQAPTEDGYVRAENVTFEVLPTGEIQRVEMKDDFTKVEISKKDITNGEELRGAHLRITDTDGSVVAEWVTDGQPHRIDRLQSGEYLLTETAAPNGYKLAESVRFVVEESGRIQKVTMYDAPVGTFTISKLDETSNTALAGAQLALVDGSGTVIDRWQTTGAPHVLPVLTAEDAAGDPWVHLLLFSTDTTEYAYTLVEEGVPAGYLAADSITFKLMQVGGELTMFLRADTGWQKADEPTLRMYDARNPNTPVPEVHKTFPQTGEFLPQ